MTFKDLTLYLFSIIYAILISTQCTSKLKLSESQSLLVANRIDLKNFKADGNQVFDFKTELSTLYKQKPNRNWMLIFDREKIFSYLEKKKYKKILIRNTLEKVAEAPSILDTSLVSATQKNMSNYLFNKGYFNVKVESKIKVSGSKSHVHYMVNPGRQFVIDSLYYIAEDSAIRLILERNRSDAILKKGSPIDNLNFQAEKSRISELLKNNGYAEFAPYYIQNLDVDTSKQKTIVNIKINNPDSNNRHKLYTIAKINIHTNYNPTANSRDTLIQLENINFINSESPFYISNEKLTKRILLKVGDLYRKSAIDSTYFRLSNLDYYKFINIDSKVDSSNKNQIIQTINLTPHYKWLRDIGAEANYTSLKATSITSLLGTSIYTLLRNRNINHSGSSFETKLEAGMEINFFAKPTSNVINAFNLNFNNTLQLPDFYDLTRVYKISSTGARWLGYNLKKPYTKTNINLLGLEYVQLNNLFEYFTINNSVNYNIPLGKNRNLNIGTIDLSLYFPDTFPEFNRNVLASNEFLKKSFSEKRLFTSFFISKVQFFEQQKKSSRWSKSFIANFEISGLEASLIDGISELISNKAVTKNSKIKFSKFIKLESEHRWNYSLPDKNELVFRINYGAAIPFKKSNSVPYIRQFFMGGPQSMRGWRLRELGPGADTISKNQQNGNYYSSGDLKLEINAEFRFRIYWVFEGALFTDIGNLWLLPNSNLANELGVFKINKFYKQIAVSSGLGLRMDVNYFVLRLDYGIKWRNPYPDENGLYGIYTKNPITIKNMYANSSFQLALNYPF
ncbi:MAG: BamA/TamA family outer membrane protein [Saprospiraceae bacterium]|nr:BamA/TamA family outer membrane protein [Saprospiraceae bacterium]